MPQELAGMVNVNAVKYWRRSDSVLLVSAISAVSGNCESTVIDRTLICFSHLRWDFVYQRPQHLLSRFTRRCNVLFWEEPIVAENVAEAALAVRTCPDTGVVVVTPQLPATLDAARQREVLQDLLNDYVGLDCGSLIRWYYTPMMLPFSEHLVADCIVYDCMDELANFNAAPAEMVALEQRLLQQADLVFTGGHSLYEAKRSRHSNVHAFPSSVDVAHFRSARAEGNDPPDQAALPTPRLGFYGVIDERMDLELVAAVADARPDWSVVMIGPVVKIAEADLPRRSNLHYLGARSYAALPDYLRGWDIALMPFAINDATKFISPTKTPEYLAGGRPVVSTPVADVVRDYGALDAVSIASSPGAFVAACVDALALSEHDRWIAQVDEMLAGRSWDLTAQQMYGLIEGAIETRIARRNETQPIVSPSVWPAGRAKPYDVMVVGAGFRRRRDGGAAGCRIQQEGAGR